MFPNSMLDRAGDASLLQAPRINFYRDLDRIPLPPPKFRAHPSADYAAEAADADTAELDAALRDQKTPTDKRAEILRSYAAERAKLTSLRSKLQQWNSADSDEWINGEWRHHDPKPRPLLTDFNAAALASAPPEFADYLEGSVAWFNAQTNDARQSWETLLHRPAAERHYRSTWAAYMLGKSWAADDPERAAAYFQQVRVLKFAGFADRLGLAAASLGEEARVRLHQTNYLAAIDLYAQQQATGDGSAACSLRVACREALTNGPDILVHLAADPVARRIATAFLASDHDYFDQWNVTYNLAPWLAAVEAANVKDMACTEELALLAYQNGQFDAAQRWINLAPSTPSLQWLQAKLLLRSGKTDQAAAILDQIIDFFPESYNPTNDTKPRGLQDVLFVPGFTYTRSVVSAHAQALAERGVLHLTRREYTESLDALLRAGFWFDAAYVAERVLTLDELKNYVDANWTAPAADATNSSNANIQSNPRADIRYLLGRRLARDGQFDAARSYYPRAELTNFDTMVGALATAQNADPNSQESIDALLTASGTIRLDGMELLGCEVAPDWAIWPGYGNFFDLPSERADTNSPITRPTADELARSARGVDPTRRYHYRYIAASLALDAANLMPDNTDEKAIVLCTAGSWLKFRDPQAADIYYKTLVRHCRKTAIGALADRMRWFPELDAAGNPVPWQPDPPTETNAPPDAAPRDGYWYSLHRGNDLQDVVVTLSRDHQIELTPAEIAAANPAINTNRLKPGLRIFAPASIPP